MNPRTPTTAGRRSRRGLLAGALTLGLLGSGAAVAYTVYQDWYGGGAVDGLSCMTAWQSAPDATGDAVYGGAELTTDPVADCARYAELTGKPAIEDPVVTTWNGMTVVGPRAGRPEAAAMADVPTAGSPQQVSAQGRAQLEHSLGDYVDGGQSRCFTATEGRAFAEAELQRLGLTGFEVVVEDQSPPQGGCTLMFLGEGATVEVRGLLADQPPADSNVTVVARQLRDQVADECLSLPEAARVTETILGAEHRWPTSSVVDPAATCTTVDLVAGGSTQVFLIGPERTTS